MLNMNWNFKKKNPVATHVCRRFPCFLLLSFNLSFLVFFFNKNGKPLKLKFLYLAGMTQI